MDSCIAQGQGPPSSNVAQLCNPRAELHHVCLGELLSRAHDLPESQAEPHKSTSRGSVSHKLR